MGSILTTAFKLIISPPAFPCPALLSVVPLLTFQDTENFTPQLHFLFNDYLAHWDILIEQNIA